MAVKTQQVRVYMSNRNQGYTQVTAAAKAGFSERTGRRIEKGGYTADSPALRRWRTRKDPFAEVWDSEIVPRLEEAPKLQAVTLLADLQARHPGKYPNKLKRTLQRRIWKWRALDGPDKEVMFRQTDSANSEAVELLASLVTLRFRSVWLASGVKPRPNQFARKDG